MNLELEAMALEMPEVEGHPNRLPFHGVLTLVGIASRRAPSGARGHRVMLTRKATETALPSLLGMALDYAPALDAHDARRKIGVITEAEIVPLRAAAGNIEVPQGLKPSDKNRQSAPLKPCPFKPRLRSGFSDGLGGTDHDQRISVCARFSGRGGRVARGTRLAGDVV